MRDAYVTRRLTLRQMATEAECGVRTIARWMELHGIPTDRTRIGNHNRGADCYQWKGGPPTCPVCGSPISFYSKTCQKCRDVSGSNNPKWLGDNATYAAMHDRTRAALGDPAAYACTHCLGTAQEWAYDHRDADERRQPAGKNAGLPYSLSLAHYIPLCVGCHRKFDNKRRRGVKKSV